MVLQSLWAAPGASDPDDIPVARRAGFGLQIEMRDGRWGNLKNEIELQSAKLGISGEPRVRVFLGTPEKLSESNSALVVESDVSRWKAAMLTGTAVIANRTIALAYQARIVLEVAGLLAYPDQREFALRGLSLKKPWIEGNERESLALQIALATLAARSELPIVALQLLRQAASPQSDPRRVLRTLSLTDDPKRDDGSVLNLCLEAVRTFAEADNLHLSDENLSHSDEELVQRFVESGTKDKGAFAELMSRHGDAVYALLVRVLRSDADAKDLRQLVFLEAFRGAHSFSRRSSVRNWLLSIATHRAMEELQRSRSSSMLETRLVEEALSPEPHLENETASISREQKRRILEQALAKLQPVSRAAIMLRMMGGLSYQEIAQLMGESHGTVQVRISRALPILRKEMKRLGLGPEDE